MLTCVYIYAQKTLPLPNFHKTVLAVYVVYLIVINLLSLSCQISDYQQGWYLRERKRKVGVRILLSCEGIESNMTQRTQGGESYSS
jgi:hypothetical protein